MNNNIKQLAQQTIEPLGFEVLEVSQQTAGELVVLIKIDRLDEQPVSMEDIITASRAIGAVFDEQDPISGEYRLEVESPGSKRPLTRARHFERMIGLKAKVKGEAGHAGFTGQIISVDGETVTFKVGDEEHQIIAGHVTAHLAEFPDRHR